MQLPLHGRNVTSCNVRKERTWITKSFANSHARRQHAVKQPYRDTNETFICILCCGFCYNNVYTTSCHPRTWCHFLNSTGLRLMPFISDPVFTHREPWHCLRPSTKRKVYGGLLQSGQLCKHQPVPSLDYDTNNTHNDGEISDILSHPVLCTVLLLFLRCLQH